MRLPPKLEAARPSLTVEMLHEAALQLHRDAVPPHADGFYRLHAGRLEYRISTDGVIETDQARKLRRFNERCAAQRPTSWRDLALEGFTVLMTAAGRAEREVLNRWR